MSIEPTIDWSAHPVQAPVAGVRAWQVATPRMTMALYELEPGVQVPEHAHAGDEVGLIIAGSLEVQVDGQSHLLSEGQTFVIPQGAPHAARTTDRACRLFECYAPHR